MRVHVPPIGQYVFLIGSNKKYRSSDSSLGMLRLTKDLLAIVITSVFLIWVLATAFVPVFLHAPVYNDKGQTFFGLNALAATVSLVAYFLVARGLPERVPAETK
jgi:uncharacterized membrane protein (DUF485 family)